MRLEAIESLVVQASETVASLLTDKSEAERKGLVEPAARDGGNEVWRARQIGKGMSAMACIFWSGGKRGGRPRIGGDSR